MSRFATRYTREQKDAAAQARLDRKLTAKRVTELAASGDLTLHGDRLEPFECDLNMVYQEARKLEKRRRGELASGLTDVPHHDAIESLRRRLISVADNELRRIEDRQGKGRLDPEHLRQIARCTREIAAIPTPKDGKATAPGQRDPQTGQHVDGATKGGLAGSILAAARKKPDPNGTETVPEPTSLHQTQGDTGQRDTGEGGEQGEKDVQTQDDRSPGSLRRALVS